MYDTYKCENCLKNEFEHLVVHLEDGAVVCKDCYFPVVDTLNNALLTLQDIKNCSLSEEQVVKRERELLRRMRKLCVHNSMGEFETLRLLSQQQNNMASEHTGKDYLSLGNNDKMVVMNKMTTYLHEVFEDVPPSPRLDKLVKLSKTLKLSDYYKMLKS